MIFDLIIEQFLGLTNFDVMSGNSFGRQLRLTTFGESHGPAIGGILEGMPSGVEINVNLIQKALNRRRPGQSALTTPRNEEDVVEILSGIFEGKTTGTSIGFIIRNKDFQSADYSNIKDLYRPSHADYTYDAKYGFRDYRGGGRSSARETACRVVGGAIAAQIIPNIQIHAFVRSVGAISSHLPYQSLDFAQIDNNSVRCPDPVAAAKMEEYILQMKEEGDSIGGIIECVIQGVPAGLGEPVFDKLHAELGKAMLSINAVKGFEYGSGFEGTRLKGSQHNDEFLSSGKTKTNHSGGIQGGISNGEDIYFKVAFKPIASIKKTQSTVDTEGKLVDLVVEGRHDPCVLPRAVPIVEAMATLVIADAVLLQKIQK